MEYRKRGREEERTDCALPDASAVKTVCSTQHALYDIHFDESLD
jgi:hypothetical protein